MSLVALSASYGAGGALVGPALAKRLGVPFCRRRLDRAHAEYARRFYGADMADYLLYDMVDDSTAIDLEACVELLATAARARAGA